jgi:hypothetical protein
MALIESNRLNMNIEWMIDWLNDHKHPWSQEYLYKHVWIGTGLGLGTGTGTGTGIWLGGLGLGLVRVLRISNRMGIEWIERMGIERMGKWE